MIKIKQYLASINYQSFNPWVKRFFKNHWIGLGIILVATLIFFLPIIKNISTYSEGGDAMFNAWTLSRNHHCILREGCPSYVDGNIYFPNKDTMLYSETQLSAGVVTLPLYFVNKNPVFTYNVWTIISFLLSGWFMYLLIKYISKGNELYSILAGLVFEFAPFKIIAVTHLQNLSIFCLPLAVLCILKYTNTRAKRYLVVLFITLVYQFYASWYQMVFAGLGVGVLALGFWLVKRINWRQFAILTAIIGLAALATLPLAKEYIRFSKSNKASFGIIDQTLYSSSVADYAIPHSGTMAGKVYEKIRPNAQRVAYNLDSSSYHGFTLYILAVVTILLIYRKRKTKEGDRHLREIAAFSAVGLLGVVLSFGPLLKIGGSFTYGQLANGIKLAVPMPYILIDKFLPQLSFIRAIGRISVLFLFFLCCMLGYFALCLHKSNLTKKQQMVIGIIVSALLLVEVLPARFVVTSKNAYATKFSIPEVHKFIKNNQEVNNIAILQAKDYQGATFDVARAENVLWSGYHNKNIFNGYSGYTPPKYFEEFSDFVNFEQDDVAQMKQKRILYILLDKQLMTNKPEAVANVRQYTQTKIYEDNRYALFKL